MIFYVLALNLDVAFIGHYHPQNTFDKRGLSRSAVSDKYDVADLLGWIHFHVATSRGPGCDCPVLHGSLVIAPNIP